MSQYECVNLAIEGDVATVELNRPEKRNCLSPTLHLNMVEALKEVVADLTLENRLLKKSMFEDGGDDE